MSHHLPWYLRYNHLLHHSFLLPETVLPVLHQDLPGHHPAEVLHPVSLLSEVHCYLRPVWPAAHRPVSLPAVHSCHPLMNRQMNCCLNRPCCCQMSCLQLRSLLYFLPHKHLPLTCLISDLTSLLHIFSS